MTSFGAACFDARATEQIRPEFQESTWSAFWPHGSEDRNLRSGPAAGQKRRQRLRLPAAGSCDASRGKVQELS